MNVDELLSSRQSTHGDPVANMTQIAQLWSAFLNVDIEPWQVPVMCQLIKFSRMQQANFNPDDFDDNEGYARIASIVAKSYRPHQVEQVAMTISGMAESVPVDVADAFVFQDAQSLEEVEAVEIPVPATKEGVCPGCAESITLYRRPDGRYACSACFTLKG